MLFGKRHDNILKDVSNLATQNLGAKSYFIESEYENGAILTSSLLVAEKFGKRHDHVLRDIRGIINSTQKWGQLLESSTYIDGSGKSNVMYIMNRDGFTLLAMGFTGKKALNFKLQYIEAFNQMA